MVSVKEKISWKENLKKSFQSLRWYEWLMISVMIIIALYSMLKAIIYPTESGTPVWLAVVNFVSAICGILCIFFCAKASISNFAFGLVNTIVYIIYLAYWKIYGTMALELIVYLPVNIVSWIMWARHRDKKSQELTLTRKLKWWQNIIVALLVASSATGYYFLLKQLGGSVVILDAITVAIGVIAVFLELFRFREQYVWWLITDIVAVIMYIVSFDLVYLTKKSIYLIMAIVGLINWWKLNKQRNKENK